MGKSSTILSWVFNILSICFLYLIGLLQGLLAKIRTSHKMSNDSNHVSFEYYLLHIKNFREVLKLIKDNTKKISMRFKKRTNYFIVKTKIPELFNNKFLQEFKDNTINCPECKKKNVRDPKTDYTKFLNCDICTFSENSIIEFKKSMLYSEDTCDHYAILNNYYFHTNHKLITISYCYICGDPINCCNNKINCKNKEHAEKHAENYHKEMYEYLMKNILYRLELEDLYSNRLQRSISYNSDRDKIGVLFFHLKTNLFFINNFHIFQLVSVYINYDLINKYSRINHFLYITEELNDYFSDKFLIKDI